MEGKFEEWAIIDLFGHQKTAGKVSEQQIGGTSFVRVDTPPAHGQKPFTCLYGPGAIYKIAITDEETAPAAAQYFQPAPMDKFQARDLLASLNQVDGDTCSLVVLPSAMTHDDQKCRCYEGDEDELPY